MKKKTKIILISSIALLALAVLFVIFGAVFKFNFNPDFNVMTTEPTKIGESFGIEGLQNTRGDWKYYRLIVNSQIEKDCQQGSCLPSTNGPGCVGCYKDMNVYNITVCGVYTYTWEAQFFTCSQPHCYMTKSGVINVTCPVVSESSEPSAQASSETEDSTDTSQPVAATGTSQVSSSSSRSWLEKILDFLFGWFPGWGDD